MATIHSYDKVKVTQQTFIIASIENKEKIKKYIKLGKTYTVRKTGSAFSMNPDNPDIYLQEIPGQFFSANIFIVVSIAER